MRKRYGIEMGTMSNKVLVLSFGFHKKKQFLNFVLYLLPISENSLHIKNPQEKDQETETDGSSPGACNTF